MSNGPSIEGPFFTETWTPLLGRQYEVLSSVGIRRYRHGFGSCLITGQSCRDGLGTLWHIADCVPSVLGSVGRWAVENLHQYAS